MRNGPTASDFMTKFVRGSLWLFRAKFTAGSFVFIENAKGEELYVHQRLHNRHKWGLPGGFQRRGETPEQTAVREVREETGLDLSQRLIFVAQYRQPWAQHYDNLYRAQLDSNPYPLNDRKRRWLEWLEIREARWFDPDGRPTLTRETTEAHQRLRSS